jgi:hypothetical protein
VDFHQARQQRLDLDRKLKNGELTRDTYEARVRRLLVMGPDGAWWRPDGSGRGWLSWNHSRWLPGTPGSRLPDPEESCTWVHPPGESGRDLLGRALQERTIFLSEGLHVPLRRRSQEWWDFCSIAAGCAGAVIWFLFSWLGTRAPDFVTPVLIAGMAPALIYTRPISDPLLVPLGRMRGKLQPEYRVILGIAAPFIVSFLLATLLKVQGYALACLTLVIGGLLSYAIMRDPEQRSRDPGVLSEAGVAAMLVMGISCIAPAMAGSMVTAPCPDELFCATGPGLLLAGIPPAVVAFLLCARSWFAAGEPVEGAGSPFRDLDAAFRKKVAGLRALGVHVIPVQDLEKDWARVACDPSFWDERRVLSSARAGPSGLEWSRELFRAAAGRGGELGTVIMSRKSPIEPSDLAGWMQIIVEYNHDATRVVLDDGSRLVLDYWGALAGRNEHIVTEPEWVDSWNEEAGKDMMVGRSTEEAILKKCMETPGGPEGERAFRNVFASSPGTADLWIRSWGWSPW